MYMYRLVFTLHFFGLAMDDEGLYIVAVGR